MYVVSDTIDDVENARLSVRLHRYDQLGAVLSKNMTLNVVSFWCTYSIVLTHDDSLSHIVDSS